jgi:Molybdopterin-binding domain of aldehyde dehydrogenase/Amidohydrolase family
LASAATRSGGAGSFGAPAWLDSVGGRRQWSGTAVPELVVRGRRVVTPDGVRPAALQLRGGVIAKVADHGDVSASTPLVEAGDAAVLPGLVDVHVHVNGPGCTEWEGFDTATRAAAAGGVTTLVDMPLNSVPPTTTVAALAAKRAAAAGKAHVDVAFWGGIVPGNLAELPAWPTREWSASRPSWPPPGWTSFPAWTWPSWRRPCGCSQRGTPSRWSTPRPQARWPRPPPRPLPPGSGDRRDLRELPGGVANVTHGEGVRRGVGYAVGFKNVSYSEGFDDFATARVRLSAVAGEALAEVHTAAAEVGQGLVTVQAQIARTELGVVRVVVLPADTRVGSAGSSSASRQTWMTGGAVKTACEAVRQRVLARAAERLGRDPDELALAGGAVVAAPVDQGATASLHEPSGPPGEVLVTLAELLGDDAVEETREYHHRPTGPLDPETGQGEPHLAFAFAAHRAVVDVDTELGLVKVVEIATAQDVGKAINPQAVEGQIEGGIAQGLGLALMEEIQLAGGQLRNPSFTDYLIPTVLDMPPVRSDVLELGHPDSPYGLRGVGEPPTISSTPAIVAAIRAASGRPLTRVPLRPEHLVGTDQPAGEAPAPSDR